MSILTQEQTMLQDAAKAWVSERAPVSALRSVRTTHAAKGFDPRLYAEMVEMGWTGIIVPEAYGGFDFGYASFGLLMEELGRSLTASPLLSSALTVATALTLGGSGEQKSLWLPQIVAGAVIGALAVDEGPRHAPAGAHLSARASDGGWRLSGTKNSVPEAMSANLFIVVARTSGEAGSKEGITLFLCPGDIAGLSRTLLRRIDSRGVADLDFDGVILSRDAVLGAVDQGLPLLEEVLDRSRAALAAEMLGSAVQAFETTVEYLKTRVQFDRPIGSFQALQHRAADLISQIELTRSAVRGALLAIDEGSTDMPALASLAKALAGKTFRAVAREMVQMHGGIGMTDEHDAGLYLKRAHAADLAFGNVAFHRERYAALTGL